MSWISDNGTINKMQTEVMEKDIPTEITLNRPSLLVQESIQKRAEQFIRKSYTPFLSKEKSEVDPFLKTLFAYYERIFDKSIKIAASLETFRFMLSTYETTIVFEAARKSQQLNNPLTETDWKREGPHIRHALKYTIEKCCLFSAPVAPHNLSLSSSKELDEALICAEEMFRLAEISNYFNFFEQESATFRLHDPSDSTFYSFTLDDQNRFSTVAKQMDHHRSQLPAIKDLEEKVHSYCYAESMLNSNFKKQLGFSLSQVHDFFKFLKSGTKDKGGLLPYDRSDLTSYLKSKFRISFKEADALISALSLTNNSIPKQRPIWDISHEYRTYGRCLFEFNKFGKPVLYCSPGMIGECHFQLLSKLRSRKIPPEWNSKSISKSVEKYASSINKSFEKFVVNRISSLENPKTHCAQFKDSIGNSSKKLSIPRKVGEIDYIGYAPKESLIVVAEVKMLKLAHDPKSFRNNVDKLHKSEDQLLVKFDWIMNNLVDVVEHLKLNRNFPNQIKVNHIAPVLITFYPTIEIRF
ncbi:MAG: hypothetical protein R3C11_16430 [Planctomycetaceae bacterium]